MIWSTETIQRLLNLYFEHQVLWDPKQNGFSDKGIREKALQQIAEQIGMPNVTAEDINRKYRSMRAAYRVEVRNINMAKVRGFFYKPTLHWFEIFKQYIKEIEEIKMKDCDIPKQLILQGGLIDGNQYVFTIKDEQNPPLGRINKSLPPEVHLIQTPSKEIDVEIEEESPEEAYSSEEESEDEFQSYADHIAEQLRSMSVHRAVMIQNKIQRIFANDREIHEEYTEYNEEELEEMGNMAM